MGLRSGYGSMAEIYDRFLARSCRFGARFVRVIVRSTPVGKVPMKPYVISQGDYLTQLAERLRFDPVEVWAHPKNAQLRQLRPSPEILCPGDVLWVPDALPKRLPVRAKNTNSYQVKLKPAKVKIAFFDGNGPLADEPFDVEGIPAQPPGAPPRTTTSSGECVFEVPVQMRSVRITFPRKQSSYIVKVGHLDPTEETSGAIQRLIHLGYLHGTVTGEPEEIRDGVVALALARFQQDHGLPSTGQLDGATQDKLTQTHGS